LSGILIAAGYDELPGYVLPTIVPILFNLKAVRLSRQDGQLLAEVRLAIGNDDTPFDVDRLYAKLPKKTRKTVPRSDFAALVDRLVAAGEVDRGEDDRVRVRNADDPVWLRISAE
jgi:hypothetical protein